MFSIPRLILTWFKKIIFLLFESSKKKSDSVFTNANGTPGNPAPVPISNIFLPETRC